MPHETRTWLKGAEAALGELLAVAEGGRSMAADGYGILYDVSHLENRVPYRSIYHCGSPPSTPEVIDGSIQS